MKLATFRDGSRDGQLVVVSRDLRHAHLASSVAGRLQQVLDDWNFLAPQLQDLYDTLNAGKARHAFPFEAARCMAPLPRAHQWVDASAYPSHGERMRRARGLQEESGASEDATAHGPASGPLMYQGGSDDLLGPCDDIVCPQEDLGIDFEAELAVVTGDVPMGATPEQALEGIRLLMLVNDVSLRELVPGEWTSGFGFLQSKPATGFGPVAVTPDELGTAWKGGRAHLALQAWRNDQPFGRGAAGSGMGWHFGELIAHLCRTRRVGAGSIIGSGTVSNEDATGGCLCIAEQRALESMSAGAATTGYLRYGERVRIEAMGADGASLFGAIHQRVTPLHAPVAAPAGTAATDTE